MASQLLKQFSNSITLYNVIGAANQNLDQLEDAIEAFKKALSINPNYAEGHYNMGTTLKKQGELEEAVEAYNKAIAINPDYGGL